MQFVFKRFILTDANSGGDSLGVDPEGDPGQDDGDERRKIGSA